MTYGFSIKLKKGSSVTDECPGRTPFGFIVPRAHKHRYRLQWPLSRKRQRTFPFPLRSLIAESVADTVNFFLCYRLDKHRTLLLIYFLFVPAVTVGSAGGKVILPHGDLQCTEPLHQAGGVSFQRVFSILPQSRQKRNVFSSLKYQTNIAGISKIRFTRPAISLIIAPQS